jgi:hypothetical protein
VKAIIVSDRYIAVVDDEDFERLNALKWYYFNGYATSRKGFMHRLVMGFERGRRSFGFMDTQVDHINRDKLDNRKSNLRVCTASENAKNRTPRVRKGLMESPTLQDKLKAA